MLFATRIPVMMKVRPHGMRQTRQLVRLLFLVACLSASQHGWSQRPEARLAGGLAGTARAVLSGSRTPRVERGVDQGAVPPDTVIEGITLVFKRPAAQQSALDELLAAQQNPASPLYHRWLTPDTFAARFGVADEDIAATGAWLQSQGFRVDRTGRDRITFSGTAAQVQAALGAELRRYEVEGGLHFAPATDLMLPAALAPMTAAVLHLADFRPKPSVVMRSTVQPEFTAASTGAHYLTPKDVQTMYGMTALTQNVQGQGQGIAVAGQSYVDTSSSSKIAQFQSSTSGGSLPTPVLVPGSGVEAISAGDEGESELDVEYASGIAPQAQVFLVYVGANTNYSVFDSIDFAITQNIAPVISVSYGACESLLSATELDQESALFQQAAAQGQTLVAASGDSGATACADYPTSSGVTTTQQQALAVAFPASSPYVTAVGGTEMAAGTFAVGSSSYWSPSSATTGTLLSYVPEVVWNEGSVARGIIATGGGTSGHFPRPTWQTGLPGITSGQYRLVPDIALQSSIQAPGFLLCTSDRSLAGSQTSCSNGLLGSSGAYTVAGGTSFATPIFAGMVALLNQVEQAAGQGNINPTLYTLASTPATYASVFHDIATGSSACVAGAASCAAPGESAFAATPGYDQATGLGSFDFGKLVTAWPASVAPGPASRTASTLSIQGLPSSVTPGSSYPATLTVATVNSGYRPAPTGTVSYSVDGAVVQASLPLTPTAAPASSTLITLTAPMATGSHLVSASYSGDAFYLPSTVKTWVLVGGVPSGVFSLAANNLTVANGGTGTDSVTITPTSGYSGRLTWALSVTSSNGTALSACYGIGSPAVNGTSTATLTIGVGTACTSTASSGSARTFVSAAPPKQSSPWRRTNQVGVYAGVLAFGLLGMRRKKMAAVNLVALAAFAALAGLVGCGSSSSSSTPTVTPPVAAATVYTMTLKGTDSVNTSITASTTFTLTVD